MVKIIALFVAAAIAVAAAIVVFHDSPAPAVPSAAPLAVQSPPGAGRALPAAVRGGAADSADGVDDLLERLLTLDSVGALLDDALVALVERDLEAALRAAAAIPERSARDATLQRLAEFAAGIDAPAALAGARALGDDSRRPYERGVFAAWAAIDPAAVLGYLAGDASALRNDAIDWTSLAQFDVRAVLTLVNPYSSESRGYDSIERAQQAALTVWAAHDPQGAAAYTAAIDDFQRRGSLTQRVGRVYARTDPETALRWALSLEPPSPVTPAAVIAEIAAHDLDLAAKLLLDESITWPPSVTMLVLSLMDSDGEADWDRRLAERLARTPGERADRYLSLLVARWDPYEAFDWVAANAQARQVALFGTFRSAVAKEPRFAAYAFNRLPPALRGEWLVAIGDALGEASPQEAVALVATLRGDARYEAALVEVVAGIANTNVLEAARMLEGASPAVRAEAVPRVAPVFARENVAEAAAWAERFDALGAPEVREAAIGAVALAWGRQDGAAAALWANRFVEPAVREAAIGAVARGWAATEANGARAWALSLPRGAMRDAGVGGVLAVSAIRSGTLDESLVAELSSDAALQTAVSRVVSAFAYDRNRVETAQALIERFLTDEDLREHARLDLARAAELNGRQVPGERPAPATAPPISAADALRNAPTRSSSGEASEISGLEAVRTRREAHTVLAVRGHGHDVVERAADTLSGWNRRRFIVEALERRASFDGYGAFSSAAALDAPLRDAAVQNVGAAWAAYDAIGALAAADRLPEELRFFYFEEVFAAWARVDVDGMLRHVEAADLSLDVLQVVLVRHGELIRNRPDTVSALRAKLPELYRGFLGPVPR